MNHIYRTIWNCRTKTCMAVPETAGCAGGSGAVVGGALLGISVGRSLEVVLTAVSAALVLAGWSPQALAGTPTLAATAVPVGGQVVGGQASIAQSGTTTTITQGSARAAIDWQSFNVGTATLASELSGATGAAQYKTYDAAYAPATLTVGGTRNFNYRAAPAAVGVTVADKVYDGRTVASVSAVTGTDGDQLALSSARASFASKNVGTQTVRYTGTLVSAAPGWVVAGYPTSVSGSASATITPLASVTWIGGASGNWFDPANWAGGAVPDRSNVDKVVMLAGVTVSFDPAGALAPADASQAVNIDRLGDAGTLLMKAGTLNVGTGGVTLDGLIRSGGAFSDAGAFNVVTAPHPFQSAPGAGQVVASILSVTEAYAQGSAAGDGTGTADIMGGMLVGGLAVDGDRVMNTDDADASPGPASSVTVSGSTSVQAPGMARAAAVRAGGASTPSPAHDVLGMALQSVLPGAWPDDAFGDPDAVSQPLVAVANDVIGGADARCTATPARPDAGTPRASDLACSLADGGPVAQFGAVVINVKRPAFDVPGLVRIELTQRGLARGFGAQLPARVRAAVKGRPVSLAQAGGSELPDWLSWDPQNLVFTARRVKEPDIPLVLRLRTADETFDILVAPQGLRWAGEH